MQYVAIHPGQQIDLGGKRFWFRSLMERLDGNFDQISEPINSLGACQFISSDLIDIDQAGTSATLRPDSGAATLRERSAAANAVIRTIVFTADTGVVEQFTGMYRVYTEDGRKPVGSFDIELAAPSTISLLTFDIVTMPSDPVIRVFVSENDVSYTEATAVSRNGYRVNAWLPKGIVKIPPHLDRAHASGSYRRIHIHLWPH